MLNVGSVHGTNWFVISEYLTPITLWFVYKYLKVSG